MALMDARKSPTVTLNRAKQGSLSRSCTRREENLTLDKSAERGYVLPQRLSREKTVRHLEKERPRQKRGYFSPSSKGRAKRTGLGYRRKKKRRSEDKERNMGFCSSMSMEARNSLSRQRTASHRKEQRNPAAGEVRSCPG